MDLRGNYRVWLEAEGDVLVAHGWGGQRIEIPASRIGRVCMVSDYRLNGTSRPESLLILDRYGEVLLRAPGKWQVFGSVQEVCEAAGLRKPTYRGPVQTDPWSYKYQSRRSRSYRYDYGTGRSYSKAMDYRRLRTGSLWMIPRRLVQVPLALAVLLAFAFIGLIPGVALPDWFGDARVLIGIAGVVLGLAAGLWVFRLVSHGVDDSLSWAFASARVRRPAPPGRFFQFPGWPSWQTGAATLLLWALVPTLIVFGPVIGIVSGAHGLADSSLVGQLRSHGVRAAGFLNDNHQVTVESNGSTEVSDVPVLRFSDRDGFTWTVTDPSIGGRPLPLDSADPVSTHRPVTVVYLPDDPDTAAASGQLHGSVWNGAPTANVITSLVLTFLGLPLLAWRLVRRYRRRWTAGSDLLDRIATGPGERDTR